MEADGFYQSNYNAYENPPAQNNNFQPSYGGDNNFYGGANDYKSSGGTEMYGGGFEDEPPLLEELGINFEHILLKTKLVLNPLRSISQDVVNETDLAGPLVFICTLGAMLLLSGKMHFGYIYGISTFAVFMMWLLLKLMSPAEGPSFGTVTSILGYCLLPIVFLSTFAVLFSLQGTLGTILSGMAVVWCSWSSSKLFCEALQMNSQQPLVAYPCAMLYGVFALLTVF